MLASSWYDLVIGVDLHFELVPTPAGPVPTPFPHPFVGMVFDPMGLLVGLAISNTIGLIAGGSFKGPVLINGMVATNTGTEATNKLGVPHFIIPPGVSWAPMMRVPAPPTKPGETPEPELPLPPPGDAILITGSKTVKTMGSNQCRLGDLALSCSDPLRMPSSTLLAIPKGRPVLAGGPPALDYMAAALGMLRSKWVSNKLKALSSRIPNKRLNDAVDRVICFFTGHPVNVATGSLMTWKTDIGLPGSIPLEFERVYASHHSDRASPVGFGWSHTYDQAVWEEPGCVVYRASDGRELVFDTFDYPGHLMPIGAEVFEPLHRLTLRRTARDRWEIETSEGLLHRFALVPHARAEQCALQSISDRIGNGIQLKYESSGLLSRLVDSGGRTLRLEYDASGRLARIRAPQPTGTGEYTHAKYVYSDEGDLIEVHDALGNITRHEYSGHLMVKETDRTGLSFYFGYDGMGPDAYCVRTWGDGGIFDHELLYDKKKHITVVTNSLGATTLYESNELFAVTRVVDAHGNETRYAYNEHLWKTEEVDSLGNVTRHEFDARGNRIRTIQADGGVSELEFNAQDLPIRARNPVGAQWQWHYDRLGRVQEIVNPLREVTYLSYVGSNLASVRRPDGSLLRFEYDSASNITAVAGPEGMLRRFEYDRLGRRVLERDSIGQVTRSYHDRLGRVTLVEAPEGIKIASGYDGEDNLLHLNSPNRRISLSYAGYHKLATRTEADSLVQLRYDTEDQLVSVVNEAGSVHAFVRDLLGQVKEEHGFDGRVHRYDYDANGRVVRVERPSGAVVELTHDVQGRVKDARHENGEFSRFEWRSDGALLTAENRDCRVDLARDILGRLVEERRGDQVVSSSYGAHGMREEIKTSEGLRHYIGRDGNGLAIEHQVQFRGFPTPGWSIRLQRDSEGIELRRLLPGGLEASWHRDALERPLHHLLDCLPQDVVPDSGSGMSQFYTGAGAGTTAPRRGGRLEATAYQWRGEDQIAVLDDLMGGLHAYAHDARGRVTGARGADGREQRLNLDAVGNRYARADHSDRQYSPSGALERTENAVLEYDADGNLIRRQLQDGRTWQYRYNAAGLLSEVVTPEGEEVRFTYDPFGRRIRKETSASTFDWIWDRDVPIHELRQGEASQETPIRTWLFEPEGFTPLAQLDGFVWYSVHADHLGTPQGLYDERGEAGWQGRLDLAGSLEHEVQTKTRCPFRFPGQYADEETGLYYNRFRYYDPSLGSYITQDPIGLEGGLRAYGYVEDPLTWLDPWGLEYEVLRGGTIFREASGTNPSLTPRPGKDTIPRAPAEHAGLSFSIHQPETGKFVSVDVAKLEGTGLQAVRDSKGGHVSVFPVDVNGNCNLKALQDWADTRATGGNHDLTEKLQSCRK